MRALHEALTTAALGDCGTWVKLAKVGKGASARSARVRIAAYWHQRIGGHVVGGRTQYHSVLVPYVCLREFDDGTWLPVEIAHTAIRDRIGLGSDFALLNARWLADEALWDEVFAPAVAQARKFCEAHGVAEEEIDGDVAPTSACARPHQRSGGQSNAQRVRSRPLRTRATKGE